MMFSGFLHPDVALRDDTTTALLIILRDSDLRVIAAAFMVHSYCVARDAGGGKNRKLM